MKNVIMIHGYNGIPKVFKWLQEELEEKRVHVILPEFPPREGVVYSQWSKILDRYQQEFDKDTIVVAHSIGNEFFIRYFRRNKISVKAYISLAGFSEVFENENKEDLNRAVKDFLVSEDEIEHVKTSIKQKYSIYSDNDHIVPLPILERYPNKINSKALLIKGIGHMGSKSGIEKIPELLEIIKSIE